MIQALTRQLKALSPARLLLTLVFAIGCNSKIEVQATRGDQGAAKLGSWELAEEIDRLNVLAAKAGETVPVLGRNLKPGLNARPFV